MLSSSAKATGGGPPSSSSSTPGSVNADNSKKTRHRLAVPSGGSDNSSSSGGGFAPLLIPSATSSTSAASSSSSSLPFSPMGTTPSQYLSRLLDIQQMDIQSALDQMRTLCTLSPQRVYKTSYYRKQTKNHWARDDPAFAALQICFLFVSSIAYCVAFRTDHIISHILGLSIKWIGINWLGCGLLVASAGREIANRHLTVHQSSSHVRQGVEWLYAFDIHCNAFFPLFVLLYVVQFFLLPLVLGKSLLALIVANTLYAVAFSWYFYITHLGYRALPFLSNTEIFLFPIAAVLFVYVLNFLGYPFGFGFNASRIMARLYFD